MRGRLGVESAYARQSRRNVYGAQTVERPQAEAGVDELAAAAGAGELGFDSVVLGFESDVLELDVELEESDDEEEDELVEARLSVR